MKMVDIYDEVLSDGRHIHLWQDQNGWVLASIHDGFGVAHDQNSCMARGLNAKSAIKEVYRLWSELQSERLRASER